MFISKEEKLKLRSDIARLRDDLSYARTIIVDLVRDNQNMELQLKDVTAKTSVLAEQFAALQRDVQHRYGTKKNGEPKARPGGPKKDVASPLNAIAEGAQS